MALSGECVMDRFFLPLPLIRPTNDDNWNVLAFKGLEQYLDIALCLLRTIAERLRTAAGAEALELEWRRFLDGYDPLAQSEIVARVDALVTQKMETEVVRLFRELLLVTWDQAFDLYTCWSSWDRERKMRLLQMAELRKLFAALALSQQKESSKILAVPPIEAG
jgi:hypothetical protein